MTQMIGSDVEAVRRLALQFEQSAQRLRTIAAQVSSGIRTSVWVGPVALRFATTWDSEHSARLKITAANLESNAKILRHNAAEQEAASASLKGNAGSSVGATKLPFFDGRAFRTLPYPVKVKIGEEIRDGLWDSFEGFMGEIDKRNDLFANLSPKDMMESALNISELVGSKVPILGGVLKTMDYSDLIGRTVTGDFRWSEWISKGGGMLASPKLPPAVRLFGLNVEVWTLVGEEAAKGDYSAAAIRDTASYAASHPGEVVEEFGKATLYVGAKFFNMLKF